MAVTRFYEAFHPTHYDIKLDINRQAKQFAGHVTIDGEALTKTISLHQKFLQVTSVTTEGRTLSFETSDEQEALTFTLPKTGPVAITVDYTAPLTDTMMGIYPSYYQVDGQQRELIGTQFETTFARQAFPSIDEPEAKATFSLAIKFDEQPGETVLANMPEERVEDGYHYFEETVKMSTYLVAFAFGDLQKKVTETTSGVKVGVFATKAHQAKELDFALDIAKRAIEFYEDFYQTKYPLPHSWQLALPGFSAGAMENWGLVTYREAYLLVDPDNTALDMKRVVATVITHELAHQWFGDLVTMKWWDDLWLNESFANMMEYLSVDALEPDWHIWELFQTTEAPMALQRDATDGVQSVHVAVNDPAEIDALFDGAIVYAKGSRMLVMVRALLGDDKLREGLKNYFAAHQYGNATGADLWQALGDAAGINIGEIMNSWLEQPGYPVVAATVENGHLILSQEQFFIGAAKEQGRTWEIPLNANFAAPQIMKDARLDLGDYRELRAQAGEPLRINVGNNSHFIVNYDATLLEDILKEEGQLDAITKRQLLQDLRLLAEGKRLSYATLVPLLTKFKDDPSSIVNTALYQIANFLKNFTTPGSDQEANLKHFFDQLSVNQASRLTWSAKAGEAIDDQLTRPLVLSAALYADNAQAKEAAHQIFLDHQNQPLSIEATIRPLVLKNEVQNFNTSALFDQLLTDYRTTSDPSYKQDLRGALVATKETAQLRNLVDHFEDATTIKPQDLRGWYHGVLANPTGQQLAWDWIRNEWDWLDKTVGGDMEFATFITVTAAVFHTRQRSDEFNAFFEPKENVAGLTREITMDKEVIASKVALIESQTDAVNQAVAQQL